MTDSGAWDAGVSEGVIEGVRWRMVECCEARRGKKAQRVVTVERKCALMLSAQIAGERVGMGWVGRERGGTRIREVRWRLCGGLWG